MKSTRILDWTIITLGLISTVLVTIYVQQKNYKEDVLRFDYETNLLVRRFQTRMESYEGTLIQVRAFLKNSEYITREELQKYIKDTEIFQRSPGLQGIGFSLMLRPEDIPEHLKVIRKAVPLYRIFPWSPREIYSSIIILEPEDRRNLKAIGFDMYSDPKRREAMDRARDLNSAQMTDNIVLVQEDERDQRSGFNLYLPHYKKNVDLSTVEGRRKALVGFVYSPFRAGELFNAIFSEMNMVLDVEVYSGEVSEKNLFFDYLERNIPSDLHETKILEIHGKKFIFKTSPLPNFERASSLLKTIVVFLTGVLVTLLIYSIYRFTKKQMTLARLMADEKQRLLEKEKEHVAARDDFLSIASHELKTPLTSLKLQAQVMMRAIDRNDPNVFSQEKVTNLVKQIDNQTTRLTRLVDDMLDISRIRTGRLKIEKEFIDLNEVVLDVIERLRPQFIKNIGDVPRYDLAPGIKGNWDRFRLEQVMTNLLTNAVRYGNGRPIQVKTTLEGSRAKIFVIDQGIGIAKENTEKIFERFERAGMSANEVSGLGLGLYITNQIVKAHGGTIRVESELQKGSTFIVELPL